jgi:16S rRNA (cytosine967-C5)-methyltransferase
MTKNTSTVTNMRCIAAQVIEEVIAKGQSLSKVFPPALARVDARDQGLFHELCYGTLRWYPGLQCLLEHLLDRPLKPRQSDIQALLLLGLYQLLHLRVPAYAAVSEVVSATRQMGKAKAAGLVNAILRNFQRRHASWLKELAQDETWRHAHPSWLLRHFQSDWPNHWQTIVQANNTRPPYTLRVNLGKITRQRYLQMLATEGIEATVDPCSAAGISVAKTLPVVALPGFLDGCISVQDGAAQLASKLLHLAPGLRVLDACAAPGGKTCHILESESSLKYLLALDSDPERLSRLQDNLQRLNLKAHTLTGDACKPTTWWDGQYYDRILLDAPCSGTGVIRRHPDIKILRRASDIPILAEQQLSLLEGLWPLLSPGGMLVYATCSILKQENENTIVRFLNNRRDAQEHLITAPWGQTGKCGRQILPGELGMDGAYYACLVKNT